MNLPAPTFRPWTDSWITPLGRFQVPAGAQEPAQEDHQDYLQKNPGGYTCHFLRD